MVFTSLSWQGRKTALVAVLLGLMSAAVASPAIASSVVLNWTDMSSDETGFKVERMPSGGSYSLLATLGSNVETYTDSNVAAGSSYCYRVSAYNSAGTSAPSNSTCAQVPTSGSTAPMAPLNLIASAIAIPASVAMNWSDMSTNEAGFKIERMPSGGSYSLLATVGSNVVSYTDSNVVAGSSYCYQVRAYNSAGVSSPSNQVCVNVPSSDTKGKGRGGSKSSGSTSTSSGSATTTSSSTLTSPHGANWTDYKLTMKLKSNDNGSLGVMFRYFDNNSYYRFSWNSYNSVRRLERKLNGTFQVLAEDAVPYVRSQTYSLEILAKGSSLELKIDGNVIFQGIDSSIPRGGIALYSWFNRGSIFEDVLVKDLNNGAALLFDDFNDGNLAGWTIVDEAVGGEQSVWSVSSGMAMQSANVGSYGTGEPGSYALY